MAPERGKKSPSTVAAECGADEILIVNINIFDNFNCLNNCHYIFDF